MEATGCNVAFDVSQERLMLKYKLDLLEKFEKDHVVEPNDVVDECRNLQYKIECIQWSILYQNLAEDLLFIFDNQESAAPEGFGEWVERRTLETYCHTTGRGLIRPPATLCCPIRSCINCVYGFNRIENLEQHLQEHQPVDDQTMRDRSIDTKSNEPLPMEVQVEDGGEDHEFTYVLFDPSSSSKKREGEYLPHRAKRVMDKANMKLVKDQGACLRCRILKKKCDNRSPCSHCPAQDSNGEGDHWKVIGCHRSSLKDLSNLLLPDGPGNSNLSESDNDHESETLHHASTSATAKLRRRRSSTADEGHVRRLPTLASLPADPLFTKNWTKTAKGLLLFAEFNKEYPIQTAYTPIDLMRNSRRICEDLQWQNDHKTELDLVHIIISEAIEFFRFEKGLQDLASTADSLSEENHVPDDKNLRKFLAAFSNSCSRRTSLSVQSWIELFHALCLFSIYKTMLIDAFALRSERQHPRTWKHSDAIVIDSVYRTLVSIFTWASGVKDPMTCEDVDLEDANVLVVLKGTRELAKQSQWKQRSIKSSKDFLMNLGSGVFCDGPFNGFLLQTYRLDKKLQQAQKPRRGAERTALDRNDYPAESLRPQTRSLSPAANISDATLPLQIPDPNSRPEVSTTRTADVKQWLDGLSRPDGISDDHQSTRTYDEQSTSNRHMFSRQHKSGYSMHGNPSTPNDDSLGGTHTESWLENHAEPECAHLPCLQAFTRPPFSMIFEE